MPSDSPLPTEAVLAPKLLHPGTKAFDLPGGRVDATVEARVIGLEVNGNTTDGNWHVSTPLTRSFLFHLVARVRHPGNAARVARAFFLFIVLDLMQR